ncbi:hypothetical protein ISS30_07855 [bacterium]|nr:hypothetical protein [bacterium]
MRRRRATKHENRITGRRGDACQHSSWWCHASPHDTKTLLLLCMVSTAESRHHNELNPIFRLNPHAPEAHHQT